MRRAWFPMLAPLLAALLSLVFFATPRAEIVLKSTRPPERRDFGGVSFALAPDRSDPRLLVRLDEAFFNDKSVLLAEGAVTNRHSEPVRYMRLVFEAFDAGNEHVCTLVATFRRLKGKETRAFHESTVCENGAPVRVEYFFTNE